MSLAFDVLEASALACFYHNLASVQFIDIKSRGMVVFHMNAVFDVHLSFLMKSFLCVH